MILEQVSETPTQWIIEVNLAAAKCGWENRPFAMIPANVLSTYWELEVVSSFTNTNFNLLVTLGTLLFPFYRRADRCIVILSAL